MEDILGNRMKDFYENITRYKIPRRSFGIIRVDGKAFHTYTKGFERPFSSVITNAMNETAKALLENIQGSILAYAQSDEISILFTDKQRKNSDMWFDGNIQKISSISGSIATATFNRVMKELQPDIKKIGLFDARVFTISDLGEVVNYFLWRQEDAIRNSIQSIGHSIFSQKQLHKKNNRDIVKMLHEANHNYYDYSILDREGRFFIREKVNTQDIEEIKAKYGHFFKKDDPHIKDRKKIVIKSEPWSLSNSVQFVDMVNYISQHIYLEKK
jgi:tRNA(His) 5'-end guanylyltransferase